MKFAIRTPAQVHEALAYHYDSRHEVENDIAANREDFVRQRTASDE